MSDNFFLHSEISSEPPRGRFKRRYLILGIFVLAVIFSYVSLITPPVNFPPNKIISIAPGSTLSDITHNLKDENIIRSSAAFEFFVVFFGGEKKISPGDYYFENKVPVIVVAEMIATGNHNITKIKITLPEGLTRSDMSKVIAPKVAGFSSDMFLKETEKDEGFLFPDTYFFFPSATTEDVATTLRDNFIKKTKEFGDPTSGDFKRLITLASIVEKEASGDNDRAVIAGILSNRLAKGMALQADATLSYITGKDSSQLTISDLHIDSPYNTYIHKGLPPGPISNPGILAIEAAAHPATTPYLFYLHDKDGMIHYARTYAEHQANIKQYLR